MNTLENYLNESLGKEQEIPQPLDCKVITVDGIVSWLTTAVNVQRDNGSTTNKAFYAGICKDVKQNMVRHGNDNYVALCDCGTRDKAGQVETKLGELGFDVGERADNGGDDETTIVYIIKIDRNFKR